MNPIALIGTSPITLLVAHALAKSHEITIFEENSTFGGAWSKKDVDGNRINTKSNILTPLCKQEEKWIDAINRHLMKHFSIEPKPISSRVKLINDYVPKTVYDYDMHPLFQHCRNTHTIVAETVRSIKQLSDSVIVNGRSFCKLFIPTYAGINHIDTESTRIATPFTVIVSKHLNILTDRQVERLFYYTEERDDILDRVQYKDIGNTYSLTARIGLKFKQCSVQELVDNANFTPSEMHSITYKAIECYKNYYRDGAMKQQLVTAIAQCKNISHLDTTQFVASFIGISHLLDLD